MDKRRRPDRTAADELRSFPFKAVLSIEEYAPTDGFFGDPSLCSEELGQQLAERTADRIADEVRRYLSKFPTRTKRSA
jgi:creatinine amidohydrolase/Fe(II)-dependent formamide hydrolase-like protein